MSLTIENAHKALLEALDNKEGLNDQALYNKIGKVLDVKDNAGKIEPSKIINHFHVPKNLFHKTFYHVHPIIKGKPSEFSLLPDVREKMEKVTDGTTRAKTLPSGYHPLFRALLQDKKRVVELLLENGANSNMILAKDLFLAIQYSNPTIWSPDDLLKMLLKKGYDPNKSMFATAKIPGLKDTFREVLDSEERSSISDPKHKDLVLRLKSVINGINQESDKTIQTGFQMHTASSKPEGTEDLKKTEPPLPPSSKPPSKPSSTTPPIKK